MFAAYDSVRPIEVRLARSPYQLGSHFLAQAPKPVEYGCPFMPPQPIPTPGKPIRAVEEVAPAYDPTLNCMRDARGNAICSDGGRYPPGCPHTPPDQYFTPGITPDVTTGSRIEGQQPPPRAAGSAGAAGAPSPGAIPGAAPGGSPALPIAAGVLSVGAVGAVAYFLFR